MTSSNHLPARTQSVGELTVLPPRSNRSLSPAPSASLGQLAKGIGASAHPVALVATAVGDGIFGIVDRIVEYKLEAKRIEEETRRIRMQADLASQAIECELTLRMAELKNRRITLLKLCEQSHFEQQTIRQAICDKQANARHMLESAMVHDTPLEEKEIWLANYRQETEGVTALLHLSAGSFKECVAKLLPPPALPTMTAFRLEQ